MNHEAPPPTQIETDDEIRRVQAELRVAEKNKSVQTKKTRELPFRPVVRPPIASLVVCDDGMDKGESIRIRSQSFFIGRTEGDLQLPHDEMISSRHIAIARQYKRGIPELVVSDLESQNGLFVRVSKAPLMNNGEVIIGGGLYRMKTPQAEEPHRQEALMHTGERHSAMRAMHITQRQGGPLLLEIVGSRVVSEMRLEKNRYMIGRDGTCEICRPNDSFTAARHALLTRSERGTWVIQNQKTLNGIWLRMPKVSISLGRSCEFRIGEQRFRLKFGSKQ